MDQLIKQIEANRIALRLTVKGLAADCGITYEYCHKILSGNAPGVAYSIVQSLADQTHLELTFKIKPDILNKLITTKNK